MIKRTIHFQTDENGSPRTRKLTGILTHQDTTSTVVSDSYSLSRQQSQASQDPSDEVTGGKGHFLTVPSPTPGVKAIRESQRGTGPVPYESHLDEESLSRGKMWYEIPFTP